MLTQIFADPINLIAVQALAGVAAAWVACKVLGNPRFF